MIALGLIVITGLALLLALYWLRRARRLDAERDAMSAELDAAYLASAQFAAAAGIELPLARAKVREQSDWLGWAARERGRLLYERNAATQHAAALERQLAEAEQLRGRAIVDALATAVSDHDLVVLEELSLAAADDMAGHKARGKEHWEPWRVGALLVRDREFARRLPAVLAEIQRLRALVPCADLEEFADDELDEERAAAFRVHLRSCEGCRRRLLEQHQLQARLTDPTGHLPSGGKSS